MKIKAFLGFILFSSIFIAACTVAFAMQTNIILGLPLNSTGFYCFIFGATLFQYNLHYLMKNTAIENSDRLAWSLRNKQTHYLLSGLGLLLIFTGLFSFHLRHFYMLPFLGAIAFLYSFPVLPLGKKRRLKEFGILKIITLSLLWTLVTVWFPANTMDYDPHLYWLVFSKRFIFMFVLCLLFDMRDTTVDQKSGIKTFPVRFGNNLAYLFSYISLSIFLILSVIQYIYFPHAGFLLAMILSTAATLWVIEKTKKNQSDYIYLAGIDGMMLLQALLVYLFSLKL